MYADDAEVSVVLNIVDVDLLIALVLVRSVDAVGISRDACVTFFVVRFFKYVISFLII